MIIARIKYLTKKIGGNWTRNLNIFKLINFDWKNVLLSIASILIIAILLINIINVIKNGTERYSLIQTEVDKLNALKKQNEDLKKEFAYKSSDDYLIKVSLDELNLVYPNSKVYFIKGENNLVPYVDVKKEVLRETVVEKSKLESWYELFFK
ncbi:MAG: hypothetical protein WCO33_02860 [bacterium]